ncbi:MAG: hypothetical protein AAB881_00485 [Patescibacteria group bacterium]
MERERITISIRKGILEKIDATIDGVAVRNRSHAIEHLISKTLGKESLKNAVILVGGKGANKTIDDVNKIIVKLSQSGFNKIYIASGSMVLNLKDKISPPETGETIIEYIQSENGSGGALSPLKKIFRDTFLVVNPSFEAPLDINEIVKFHKNHKYTATVATNDLGELKGIYVLEPSVFDSIPKGFSMLEDDVLPALARNYELVVYPLL